VLHFPSTAPRPGRVWLRRSLPARRSGGDGDDPSSTRVGQQCGCGVAHVASSAHDDLLDWYVWPQAQQWMNPKDELRATLAQLQIKCSGFKKLSVSRENWSISNKNFSLKKLN